MLFKQTRKPKWRNNFSLVVHAWRRKPALVLRCARFLGFKILGLKIIRGADIAITFECNLLCPHCNVAGEQNPSRQVLQEDEIVQIIRQLQAVGGFYITFTGGEPLLKMEALERIIQEAGRRSMLWQVQTNGTLLNDETCARLQKMGIDNVQLSFDILHDCRTWPQIQEITEKRIAMLKAVGIKPILTWLASHETLTDQDAIKHLIDFSLRHKVPVGLNMAVPQGRWQSQCGMLLTPDDSRTIRRLAERNRYLFIDLQNSMLRYGCPAFFERFYINAYAEVQPCTFFQIHFGNLREEPLRTIWRRGLQWHLYKGFPEICPPAEDPDFIKRWAEQCGNGKLIPISYREFHE